VKRVTLGALTISALILAGCGGSQTVGVTPALQAPTAPLSAAGTTTVTEFQRGVALGYFAPVCDRSEEMHCHAYLLTESGRLASAARLAQNADRQTDATTVSGYGPAQLQAAYGTASAAASGGSGRLIAIVDAYDDPNLEADLGVYRSHYGLSACTTANGCFKKVSQTGTSTLPAKNASWAEETSLDVDMVSANCPNCHIVVVEAKSASTANLAAGAEEAYKLGAVAISNSYGGSESSTDATYAADYNHSGIAITASNGDDGYGVEVPAAYGTVTAVGGTSLDTASGTRGYTETVWSGSGSGCSKYEAKPTWQKDTGCTKRTVGDVAYIGDPNTGVAVYDSLAYEGYSGWLVFGGTSVGAPSIAAIYGLAGNSVNGASLAYSNKADLYDVTSGSNGSCTTAYLCNGETGYDAPTGNGTPHGTGAF
jgi:subtilase family serine protease